MTFRYDPATGKAKVTIYAGLDHLGKQRQRTKTWSSPNLSQAKREASKHETRLRQELDGQRERAKTLNGLIDDWQELRDAKDSPSTVRKRAGMIARIRGSLGAVRLEDLTAKHVDKWMADMRAQTTATGERVFTDTTIANHWSCLRAILRQGDRWDMVTARPTTQARPPRRISNRRPTPPTTNATRLLIETAKPDLRIAAMLGAYAGLRRGEVMALRWPDVDGTVVHVRRALVDVGEGVHVVKLPKSGVTRDVAIDGDLAAALLAHRRRLEQLAVERGGQLAADAAVLPLLTADVTGRTPRPLGWLTLAWQRHAKRQGAPDVRFHDLRHHFASELIDGGVPIKVVQDQLGHLQMKTTTDIYAHTVDGAKAEAAEVLRLRRALPSGAPIPS